MVYNYVEWIFTETFVLGRLRTETHRQLVLFPFESESVVYLYIEWIYRMDSVSDSTDYRNRNKNNSGMVSS